MKRNFIETMIGRAITCTLTFVITWLLPVGVSHAVWLLVYGAFALSIVCGLVEHLVTSKSFYALLCWLFGIISLGLITRAVIPMDGFMSYFGFCSVLVVDGCIAVFEEQSKIID